MIIERINVNCGCCLLVKILVCKINRYVSKFKVRQLLQKRHYKSQKRHLEHQQVNYKLQVMAVNELMAVKLNELI